jgi:hypothetical protein
METGFAVANRRAVYAYEAYLEGMETTEGIVFIEEFFLYEAYLEGMETQAS